MVWNNIACFDEAVKTGQYRFVQLQMDYWNINFCSLSLTCHKCIKEKCKSKLSWMHKEIK